MGQSLMEVLIGVALGAIFVIGTASLIAPSLKVNKQLVQVQTRVQLANELMENVRSWVPGNWDGMLTVGTGTAYAYYLNTATSSFSIVSGTESIAVNSQTFHRYFYLGDVYRDSGGSVTTTASGNNYDPSTKFVIVSVAAVAASSPGTTTIGFYVTRSANNVFNQTSWAGGPGQNGAVAVVGNRFATEVNIATTTTGAIQLAAPSGGSCTL